MIAVLGADELRVDAYTVPRLSNAALESRSNSQSPPDLGHVKVLALKSKG